MLTVNLSKRDLVTLVAGIGGPEGGLMDATYYVSPYESGWNLGVLYNISDKNLWSLYKCCLNLEKDLNVLLKNPPKNWQKRKNDILTRHKSKMLGIISEPKRVR